MAELTLFNRIGRVTAYRAYAGQPGSFESQNPQFFDHQPNGIQIQDLRFEFDITKSSDKEPNVCEIKITNCSETTRAFLQAKPLSVLVQAGYQGTLQYLFKGDLRYGYSTHEGTDWTTVLQLADGDRAFRYAQLAKSYRKGTTVMQVLQDAAKSMGLGLSPQILAQTDLLAATFPAGRTVDGATRDELTLLLSSFGYRWSIQNGQIRLVRDDFPSQQDPVVIGQSTGMIGSPEFSIPEKTGKAPTLKLKHLLYPELTPGDKVAVQSQAIDGIFRIEKVKHQGGTADDDEWSTEIECKKIGQ